MPKLRQLKKIFRKGSFLVLEVENAHSCIELERRCFRPIYFNSCIKNSGEIKKLLKKINFLKIPFFSVKQLKYHSNLPHFITRNITLTPDLCVSIFSVKIVWFFLGRVIMFVLSYYSN